MLLPAALPAQTADLLLNDPVYHLVDRADIKGYTQRHIPTDIKPYPRELVAEWLADVAFTHQVRLGLLTDSLTPRSRLPDTTRKELNLKRELRLNEKPWLHRARWHVDDKFAEERKAERGFFKYFFRNRRDLLHAHTWDHKHSIYANPVFYGGLGIERAPDGSTNTLLQNTRGFQLYGTLFKKIGYYTEFTDNQAQFPGFIDNRIENGQKVIWGEGFYKDFDETGYDYLAAKGYITYSPNKVFRLKFGRDQNFWGHGVNSLFLSDHSVDALQLQYTVRFWKMEYTTLIAQYLDYLPNKPDIYGTFPRKWGVFHQLLFRPSRQVSIGLFESTIYANRVPNATRGLELQYLNPLILFRTIEQAIGSPDNTLIGLNWKANLLRRFQWYGQLLLDDFNFSQSREGRGYFGNRFAVQTGVKWIDVFGVPMLDAQVEFNLVRPYVYAHFNPTSNYANYDQALAHPQGANFHEVLGVLRYRPHHRLGVEINAAYIRRGIDDPTRPELNFGGNIFRSNSNRDNGTADTRFGHTIGQGITLNDYRVQARITYPLRLLPFWVEFEGMFRSDNGTTNGYAALNLRWAIPAKPIRF